MTGLSTGPREVPWLDRWLDEHGSGLITFRRELHQNPELGYAEHRTTARLAAALSAAGLQPHILPTGTGLYCDIGSGERVVAKLLPVLDDLERALEAAAQHEEAKLEEGVRLVHRELVEALAREGLVEVETDGQFDPHVHEALVSQPSEQEDGSVIEVLQKGYRLGDRVLRPARVVVSQGE